MSSTTTARVAGSVRTCRAREPQPAQLRSYDLGHTDATLVFYCSGQLTAATRRRAPGLGYENAFVMPDGIAGWEKPNPTEAAN
jgi:hypothetical protein